VVGATNPATQTFPLLCYALFLGLTAHAVLGIARTVAVKLPLRRDAQGYLVDLFPGDYSPKLGMFDGRGRKTYKIMVLTGCGLVATASWLAIVRVTYSVSDPKFGWTLWNGAGGYALNAVIFAGVCALAARVGVQGAYDCSVYSLPHPYQRFAPYLMQAIHDGKYETRNDRAYKQRGVSMYTVTLPVRGSVEVFVKDDELEFLHVGLSPEMWIMVGFESTHDAMELATLDALLTDNDL
jgi:hypothetical protein